MSRFPRDDYRSLGRYLPDRRRVAVDLSDNTNLWGPHPAALRTVREADPASLAGYPDLYAQPLKDAVERRFGVPAAHVCTGCGSDDILDAAFRAACQVGGLVRHVVPTFSMIGPLTRMNGRVEGPVRWSRAMADPLTLLEDEPVLVYVCRPNNPTGHQVGRRWLDALFRAVEARGADAPLVLVDEAYADFAGDSLVREAPALHRVLVLRTLSKAYGLAGLRVGWGVGSVEVVDEVEKARGPYKVSRLAEAAAVAALDDADGWVDRVLAECLENRARLVRALAGRKLSPFPSSTNFVLFPVARGTAREKALALREKGVAVRPFDDDDDVGDALRVTVGPWALIERFLAVLDELGRADPGAWRAPDDAAERLAAVADPAARRAGTASRAGEAPETGETHEAPEAGKIPDAAETPEAREAGP
ncbi:MAG TPA: histidinol-phosphate transaminase [Longimicrobiales bacterium]|nr:histidinol-phosphate transaminase [Longimicrobiales bacterium]